MASGLHRAPQAVKLSGYIASSASRPLHFSHLLGGQGVQGSGYLGWWGAVKRLSRKQEEVLAVEKRGAVLASLICFSIIRGYRNVTLR